MVARIRPHLLNLQANVEQLPVHLEKVCLDYLLLQVSCIIAGYKFCRPKSKRRPFALQI